MCICEVPLGNLQEGHSGGLYALREIHSGSKVRTDSTLTATTFPQSEIQQEKLHVPDSHAI